MNKRKECMMQGKLRQTFRKTKYTIKRNEKRRKKAKDMDREKEL